MRNAVAHLDEDFAVDEPARKQRASRKARGAVTKKRPGSRTKQSRMRYAHYAAIGLSGAVAIGIMVNALVLQHSRHPAPLFGKAIQLGDHPMTALAAADPVPLPVPVSAPPAESMSSARTEETASVPIARVVQVPVPRPRHVASDNAPAGKPKLDDPIAKLLRISVPPSSAERAREKESPKTVFAAQHALMKLGFVVRPNGTFGPATRAAIEAFERDQHLPVKGEMSRKLLKQLSAESGVAIN